MNHRLGGGVTFDSTYTWAKNLADNQGYAADHFADENSGHRTMDLYNLKHEYGDVYGTRRHRWITTAIYDLPIGRGRKFGSNMNRFAVVLFPSLVTQTRFRADGSARTVVAENTRIAPKIPDGGAAFIDLSLTSG